MQREADSRFHEIYERHREDVAARLSEADREVLRLVAWEQLSPRAAARTLGCSQVASRVRFHRAPRLSHPQGRRLRPRQPLASRQPRVPVARPPDHRFLPFLERRAARRFRRRRGRHGEPARRSGKCDRVRTGDRERLRGRQPARRRCSRRSARQPGKRHLQAQLRRGPLSRCRRSRRGWRPGRHPVAVAIALLGIAALIAARHVPSSEPLGSDAVSPPAERFFARAAVNCRRP